MLWRLGLLGAVTAGILYFLLRPTATFEAKVDLSSQVQFPANQLAIAATAATNENWIIEGVVVLGVSIVTVWIAWLIVRRYRIKR